MCNWQVHQKNQIYVMQLAQNQKFQHLWGWPFGSYYLPQKSNLLNHHPNDKRDESNFHLSLVIFETSFEILGNFAS